MSYGFGSGNEEVANWWFSDEDLQDAVNNIIDVPKVKRKNNPQNIKDEKHGTKE